MDMENLCLITQPVLGHVSRSGNAVDRWTELRHVGT